MWNNYTKLYYIYKYYISQSRKRGIIGLIYKNEVPGDLGNYRPIIIPTTTYKIWAAIIENRLAPIMNLRETKMECAYKQKKSTRRIIFYIYNKICQNKTQGGILLDSPRAFAKIDRGEGGLCCILYSEGLPAPLLKTLINGHTNTQLCCKYKGTLGNSIRNNVGVPQGSPVSAKLFIIYMDNVMREYKTALVNSAIPKQSYLIRNGETEFHWARYQIVNNNLTKTSTRINIYNSSINTTNTDNTIFPDDICRDIPKIEHIYDKLILFNNVITNNSLIIQWGKVYILLKKRYCKSQAIY